MTRRPVFFPAMDLYVNDWLTGRATLAMTCEQIGGFINLLAHAWKGDPPCSLPDDEQTFASLSRLHERWSEVGGPIRRQFTPIKNRPGFVRNPKQHAVYKSKLLLYRKRQAAGNKGNAKRWPRSQNDRTAIPPRSPSSSGSIPVSDAVSVSEETPIRKTTATRPNGQNGIGNRKPSESQYLYYAGPIARWINANKRRYVPGDPDFDAAFQAEFQFTWSYWEQLSDRFAGEKQEH